MFGLYLITPHTLQSPTIGIERIQIEHDSGKSIHTSSGVTLVDLNRAGLTCASSEITNGIFIFCSVLFASLNMLGVNLLVFVCETNSFLLL